MLHFFSFVLFFNAPVVNSSYHKHALSTVFHTRSFIPVNLFTEIVFPEHLLSFSCLGLAACQARCVAISLGSSFIIILEILIASVLCWFLCFVALISLEHIFQSLLNKKVQKRENLRPYMFENIFILPLLFDHLYGCSVP